MDLLKGFIYGLIAQVITFMQLQGQMKYSILKNNTWFVVLLGLPISYLFMISVKHFIAAYDGQIWPSRLIGFGIGVVVFSLMSHWLFKEPFTLKTLICLGLGSLIVLIQILWK
jgi:multidrug transporter EmrE-like cation transporter